MTLNSSDFHAPASAGSPSLDALIGERPDWWWTAPRQAAHGARCLRLPNLASCSREQAQAYFENGWALNELLFSALQGEEAFTRSPDHGLRHPMIFYYGHTATLFVNKLRVAGLLPEAINERFERVFEVGVDEMSWDDMSKNEMAWPSVREVAAYRQRVFEAVSHIIQSHPGFEPGAGPITPKSPLWALFMGMEHDRIHLETSSVLIRETPLRFIRRPEGWPSAMEALNAPKHPGLALDFEPVFLSHPGGAAELGKAADFPSYGWDNEYGRRRAHAAPFEASRHLITNAQFLHFVKAGGYANERYWSSEGWRWRSHRNTKHPKFWVPQGPSGLHEYGVRALFETIDWAPDWPVCVNFHEAKAYAAWRSELDGRSYRLPSEGEHALLRRGPGAPVPQPLEDAPMRLDSEGFKHQRLANACLAFGSEVSVLWARPADGGSSDAAGNLWDWCEDDFHPLEGFEPHPFYDDFSSPCFDGRHAMILGGSFISTGSEASAFARFHFRRHFHQHSGFRLIASSEPKSPAVKLGAAQSKYDQRSVADQYLLFHYGPDELALPASMSGSGLGQFPQRVARRLAGAARRHGAGMARALDIGCAVGGGSFELARAYDSVLGVDLSEPFIDAARALLRGEEIGYRAMVEGEVSLQRGARATLAGATDDVIFRVGDACDLDPSYEGFDAVLASNLLCRLPDPKAFLARLGGDRGLVRPGGVVAFASPRSWMEQFTPKSAWLGGVNGAQGPTDSFEGLKAALGDEFELIERDDMPFMIREHQRKFEYVVSDLTIWRRKA